MGNFLFKILMKIIATWLGSFVGDYLSSYQFGFILGKRIHTCIVLTSNIVNSLDTTGAVGNMAIKIDMIKAFDTVDWDFLITILEKMGFSARSIPRAPAYILYADNILIFAKACDSNIRCLRDILTQYGVLSSQVFSPAKSILYFGSFVNLRLRRRMCRLMGIGVRYLPIDYLGVLIFRGAPKVQHLARLADSMICKFGRWKGSMLSLAGHKVGLGIMSIKGPNESFICKLAWDILCNDSEKFGLQNRKYIKLDGTPKIYCRSSSIWGVVHESEHLGRGCMDGFVRELMITRLLGVVSRPRQPRTPIPVRWFPPQTGWYKANIDGSASSAPGCLYAGVVFHNSRGFFAGAFFTPIGRGYPLEAELAIILLSILFAHAQGWSYLWVESDSSLAIDTVLNKIPLIPWRVYGVRLCRQLLI
ncbi:hypothetical protein ACS0TY_025090 [Phlomoides rotata]